MPRPIHFEIHAAEPAQAMKFYGELFGWKFTAWGGVAGYWQVRTGEPSESGIDGGLVERRGESPTEGQPINAFPCTVGVKSVDEALARAVVLGGRIAVPKMPLPGVGWLAYAKDTEGNIFGLHQPDPAAR